VHKLFNVLFRKFTSIISKMLKNEEKSEILTLYGLKTADFLKEIMQFFTIVLKTHQLRAY